MMNVLQCALSTITYMPITQSSMICTVCDRTSYGHHSQ